MDVKGEIRLTGFRLMKLLSEDGHLRHSAFSPFNNKFEWAAPEVMGQRATYSEKADIYSLGITMLELATGLTPFSPPEYWPPFKVNINLF